MTTHGREIRYRRKIERGKRMWGLYTDPINPLPVEEIRKRIKNDKGKPYSKQYVYKLFAELKRLGEIG